MTVAEYVNEFLFGIYPYLTLAVMLVGCLIRFDREPYTWKSDSSQFLRKRQLRLGSNLFHYGVLIVVGGHFVGFLAPEWAVHWFPAPDGVYACRVLVPGLETWHVTAGASGFGPSISRRLETR